MSLRSFLLRSSIRQKILINFVPIAVERNTYSDFRGRREKSSSNGKYVQISALAFFGFAAVKGTKKSKDKDAEIKPGVARPDLPTYRADEVMKHNTKKDCWVTYKAGVYDVTRFIASHPGGEQILEAAGLSIEPFWNVYSMHHTSQVYQLLEELRIGNLHEDDIAEHSGEDLWENEPSRDPRLKVLTARPFNAETPPQHQIQSLDTPNELFFVRQHMPVPELDARTHTLQVRVEVPRQGGGNTDTCRLYTLAELAAMPQHTVRAALMCAGNRRSEMNKVRPVKGLGWTTGAISNATWSGPLLRDILISCGVDPDDTDGLHVVLTGADMDATGENFNTSIPLWLAMNPNQRVILATAMNGQEIPPDHGYPLRVIVPGSVAVRSVKWLTSIRVSEDESNSHWHKKDYRSFNASTTWETADFDSAPPLYTLPVTSAICEPLNGDVVSVTDGVIQVRGYAYSGGGAKILRVDVSADGGHTWTAADTLQADSAPPTRHYGWTLWTAHVPVPTHMHDTEVELCVRATDSNHNTQPESPQDLWNIRGLLCNAYHRVKVKIA